MNGRLTVAAGAATVLASMALYPLLWGWDWFWAGAGAVLAASLVGAATRLRPVPAVLCLAASVAGVFLYLNALFAGGHAAGGLIPTASSVHYLGQLMAQAGDEMSRYAPPVPDSRGIMLMTAGGIGLIGAATDLLAVRLRRPAIAGLPLLVLFCVPLTTDARPGWVGGTFVFCLSIAGYLGLLSADARDRLRLWGRLVRRWHSESEGRGPDTRPLTAAGRRIGTAAVVLAVFLPLLVPGLRQHRLFAGSGTGRGNGYQGQISLPNPVVELRNQLHESRAQTVLTYHTTSEQPPYLQVYVLSHLGPTAWTMTSPKATDALRGGRLPAAQGLAPGTHASLVRETIRLGSSLRSTGTNASYLPLPYPARTVNVPGVWRVDPSALTLLGEGARLAGLQYSVTGDDVNPGGQQLRQAGPPPAALAGYLSVPSAFKRLSHLAHKITAGQSTAFGEALALQQWFHSGRFSYSLDVPAAQSPNALWDFLMRTRKGYCQQFAFAMAVLARLLRIPSRVVVGYTQGTYTTAGNWVVKTSDAHAWPELYFAGAGWLRFEPTPSGTLGEPGQATAVLPSYTVAPSGGGPAGDPSLPLGTGAGRASPAPTHQTGGLIDKLNHHTGAGGAIGGVSHSSSTTPLAIAVLTLLAVMLIMPRTARLATRRWRWLRAADEAARAHAAWREIRDDLTDYRVSRRDSESPRALARRVAGTLRLSGAHREALERVALAEERASYAASPADSGTLAKDVAIARRGIARSRGLMTRCLVMVMPLSALAPVRAGLQQALDVFGWIDMLMNRIRTQSRATA